MIDKSYKDNFYDGCFAEIKEELIFSIPSGKDWVGNPKDLIGNPTTLHNTHPSPYDSAPSWIEITFPGRYIHPTYYFLEGRRAYDESLLKSWTFEGKSTEDEWILLHSQSNKVFGQSERRFYSIDVQQTFVGFRINMTDISSSNDWALCPGALEVFGNIYNSHKTFNNPNVPFCTFYIPFYRISYFPIFLNMLHSLYINLCA